MGYSIAHGVPDFLQRRIVADPEAIHFDVAQVAPSGFVRHRRCEGAFPGTDPGRLRG
jgi:hypothetical protein